MENYLEKKKELEIKLKNKLISRISETEGDLLLCVAKLISLQDSSEYVDALETLKGLTIKKLRELSICNHEFIDHIYKDLCSGGTRTTTICLICRKELSSTQ